MQYFLSLCPSTQEKSNLSFVMDENNIIVETVLPLPQKKISEIN